MSREIKKFLPAQQFSPAPALLQVSDREGFVIQLALVHPILGLLDIRLNSKYAEE